MNKSKFFLVLTVLIIAFTACGLNDNPDSPVITPEPSVIATPTPPPVLPSTTPPDTVPEDDSRPPEEGMVRSPLTNEWVAASVADTRPLAVIIPNESAAVPHYNLSKASVIYEANVEGRMSRMMAIYEDWTDLEKIGNIRSLRTYYAYWAFEWDAFIVHFGGPYYVNNLLEQSTTQTVNGNVNSDSDAFFRSADRSSPHNAYASGNGLARVIRQKGYPMEYRGLTDTNHFLFTSKASPNTLVQYGTEAKNATYIDMSGCYPLTRCYFEYNEGDGLYYRSQHLSGANDGPHIDAATGEQLSFTNILVQYVKYEELADGYLVFQCHDTTRDGWFFTSGRGIHVNWEKTTDYGATRYYDDYGNEIVLNTGKTMICIVEEGDTFTFR